MSDYIAINDIQAVLSAERVIPTVVLSNRLEGRPRRTDFDRALKAEVRDPLWMLTKQWQMGEFKGDDAGSPVTAKVHVETTQLTRYRAAGNPVQAFENNLPLEAKVEQRRIPFHAGDEMRSLDLRLLMGRRWLRMAGSLEAGLADQFISQYPIEAPDPADIADAGITAHPRAWQQIAAVAGRAMDGYALFDHLTSDPTHHAHDGITLTDATLTGPIETLEAEFVTWFRRLYLQPDDPEDNAWLPERLEYAFDCSAPKDGGQQHLVANEYFHGHLDWYNLDHAATSDGLADVPGLDEDVEAAETRSFIPVPIQFDGMPNTRWWTFEEGRMNFGDIDPDTTDINKLMVMEFGLIFANDWFLLPVTVPAGTIAKVRGLSVTNVFGERTWVPAAGQGSDEDWQRWSMYTLSTEGDADVPADLSLVVVPSVPKIQEGRAIEAATFVRDEVANMVWAIETRVPLPDGSAMNGRTAARQLRGKLKELILGGAEEIDTVVPLENEAGFRYRLMTRVPENWIPFIPVRAEGSTREVQLRRAAMPRIFEGDPNPPVKIRPRSDLLRHGLDAEPQQLYNLHEEEVPRAGVRISQSFQRTRWYDGKTYNWLGVRKKTGRGERSSGLSFDRLRKRRR